MREPRLIVVSSLLTWALALLVTGCGAEPVTVQIPDGTLRGLTDGETSSFQGVPYAEPPLAALRFAPPQRVMPWSGTLDASERKRGCAQLTQRTRRFDDTSSEDCLYVNVWAPKRSGRFPVMVWLHGGAYITGSASQSEFDGQQLSEERDVVVVTVGYRLAAFGFMSHAALRSEEGTTGNIGLLDQREALQWVQRNIEALHGDPDNVTIFGESAGGGSVCMHMLSSGSRDLFTRGILESAPCTAFDHPTLAQAEAQGEELSNALGCTGDSHAIVTCLRERSTEEILNALLPNEHLVFGDGVAWWPVVDGDFLTDQPAALLARGDTAELPMIVGANADEATAIFLRGDVKLDTEAFRSLLEEYFVPSDAEAILDYYDLSSDPEQAAIRALSDMFICDARRIARLHVAAGGLAYHYHFTFGYYDDILGGGAFHTAELPFVFGNALGLAIPPAGIPLKNTVQGYWTRFAADGDPNGASRPDWRPYDAQDDNSMRLDLRSEPTHSVRKEPCDFWDTLRMP